MFFSKISKCPRKEYIVREKIQIIYLYKFYIKESKISPIFNIPIALVTEVFEESRAQKNHSFLHENNNSHVHNYSKSRQGSHLNLKKSNRSQNRKMKQHEIFLALKYTQIQKNKNPIFQKKFSKHASKRSILGSSKMSLGHKLSSDYVVGKLRNESEGGRNQKGRDNGLVGEGRENIRNRDKMYVNTGEEYVNLDKRNEKSRMSRGRNEWREDQYEEERRQPQNEGADLQINRDSFQIQNRNAINFFNPLGENSKFNDSKIDTGAEQLMRVKEDMTRNLEISEVAYGTERSNRLDHVYRNVWNESRARSSGTGIQQNVRQMAGVSGMGNCAELGQSRHHEMGSGQGIHTDEYGPTYRSQFGKQLYAGGNKYEDDLNAHIERIQISNLETEEKNDVEKRGDYQIGRSVQKWRKRRVSARGLKSNQKYLKGQRRKPQVSNPISYSPFP